jgi:Rps23 Pro-64 3,4-dihydroxylase Tpa1-like proline 4-hydroxylase
MSSTALPYQHAMDQMDRWRDSLSLAKIEFLNAKPFPYLVIDNFLSEVEAKQAAKAFPLPDEKTWTNYIHINEKKYGLNKRGQIPNDLIRVIDNLQSTAFIELLADTSNIQGLCSDELLTGAGLHQMYPGGFLNIHSDFLIHPVKRDLKRRINLILFLSADWHPEYGGELEFWNKTMTECEVKIQPAFNRCVIFLTDEYSYHGCPNVLKGPQGFSRKSLALYYYSPYTKLPSKRFTDYQARPEDKKLRLAIYLDTKAVAFYSWIKQKCNLNDDFVSRILRAIKMR